MPNVYDKVHHVKINPDQAFDNATGRLVIALSSLDGFIEAVSYLAPSSDSIGACFNRGIRNVTGFMFIKANENPELCHEAITALGEYDPSLVITAIVLQGSYAPVSVVVSPATHDRRVQEFHDGLADLGVTNSSPTIQLDAFIQEKLSSPPPEGQVGILIDGIMEDTTLAIQDSHRLSALLLSLKEQPIRLSRRVDPYDPLVVEQCLENWLDFHIPQNPGTLLFFG